MNPNDNQFVEQGGSKTPIIIGAVVVVILVVLGLYFWLGGSKSDDMVVDENTPSTPANPDNGYVQIVNVKHQYKNGTHTYAGDIDLPTPCEKLTSSAVVDPQNSNKYTLTFTTTSTAQTCAQVRTSKSFKLSFKAGKDITVEGTLNGKKLRLNMFEVRADQDLDSFDIYIKG